MQPDTSYLICATPQSGSTLLCDILRSTGAAGRPKEYFVLPGKINKVYWPVKPALSDCMSLWQRFACADSLARIFDEGTTSNGVFGAKVIWDYFDDFICSLRQIPFFQVLPVVDLLPAVFPNLHYIWVARRDRVRQAILQWMAIQAWTWQREEPVQVPNRPSVLNKAYTFNFEAIDYLIRRIRADEADWWMFFDVCGIQPITVMYEDLTLAPVATVQAILRDLHIAVPEELSLPAQRMNRQADALSEEWVERYVCLKRKQEDGELAKSPNTA